MYGLNMPRQSAIVAASSVFSPVLGQLTEPILRWMALPEPVTLVQVDNRVMFHWAQGRTQPNDLRGDTGTYQWVADSARAVLRSPHALKRGEHHIYHMIGKVEPPISYPSIGYFRLVLKFIPSRQTSGGKPEMWLRTYTPHSRKSIKPYLHGAEIVGE
jgi:hypothetical protein